MAKQATKSARNQAQTFAGNVETRTGQDVRGGGAFGPTGLAGERQTAVGQQQQDQTDAYGGIKAAQTTGGYDPTQLAALRGSAANLTATGGYDPATMDKVTNAYSDMASTGGFSPEDKARYMRQATSGVPAIYDVLSQEAQRNRSLTGGLGTGGEISQMARQMAQEQSKAATGGLVGLNTQINQNKLAGAGGLDTSQTNMAAGKRAGFGAQAGLESGVASGKTTANAQMSQLFDAQTGQINAQGNQILAEYGLQDAADETKLKVLQSLAGAPGVLGNIAQGVGQVGQIATGVGAIGGMF
jgi:hypothetical protein